MKTKAQVYKENKLIIGKHIASTVFPKIGIIYQCERGWIIKPENASAIFLTEKQGYTLAILIRNPRIYKTRQEIKESVIAKIVEEL